MAAHVYDYKKHGLNKITVFLTAELFALVNAEAHKEGCANTRIVERCIAKVLKAQQFLRPFKDL